MQRTKKLLTLFMIAAVIITTMAMLPLTTFGAVVTEIETDVISENNEVGVYLTVNNADKPCVLYTAFYDFSGNMISAVVNEDITETEYYYTIPDGCALVKSMLWSKDDYRPLCKASSSPVFDSDSGYGFINDIYPIDSGDSYQIEILTTDRELIAYDFAENVLINGEFVSCEDISLPSGYMLPVLYEANEDEEITILYTDIYDNSSTGDGRFAMRLTPANTYGGRITTTTNGNGEAIPNRLYYYKNNSSSESSFIIDEEAKIYMNKYYAPISECDELQELWSEGDFGVIYVLDTDFDGMYDYINIISHMSSIVKEIDYTDGVIFTERFDVCMYSEDDNEIITLQNTQRDYIDIADIKIGDAVTIISSDLGDDVFNTDIIIGGSSFDGKVTAKEFASSCYFVTIGDNKYKTCLDILLGEEGTFSTDIFGEIVAMHQDISDVKYGVLNAIYEDMNGADSEIKASILTYSNNPQIYEFAETVNINGANYSKYNLFNAVTYDLAMAAFTLNDNNQITALYTNSNISRFKSGLRYAVTPPPVMYNAEEGKLGRYQLTGLTSILGCRNSDIYYSERNDFFEISHLIFNDGREYDARMVVNDNNEILYVVVLNAFYEPNRASIPLYVTDVGTVLDSQGGEAIALDGYVNGEKTTLTITDECDSPFRNYSAGSVVQYLGDEEPYAADLLFDYYELVHMHNFGEMVAPEGEDTDIFAFADVLEEIDNNYFIFESGREIEFDRAIPAMKLTVYEDHIYDITCEDLTAGDTEPGDYLLLAKWGGTELCAISVHYLDEPIYDDDETAKSYSMVVTKTDEETYRVSGYQNGDLFFEFLDPDNADDPFTLTDENGNELSFNDIKKDDILTFVYDGTQRNITLSNRTVWGTLTAIYQDYCVIEGEKYNYYGDFLKPGVSGEFFIDINNTVVHCKEDISDIKYGLMFSLYEEDNGFEPVPTVCILDNEKFTEYTFAKKVDVNGFIIPGMEVTRMLPPAKSLILYKVNDDNEITAIYNDIEMFGLNNSFTMTGFDNALYSKADSTLDYAKITDDTVIINCTAGNLEESRKNNLIPASKLIFADECIYNATALCNNEDEILYMIVYGARYMVDESLPPMYVTSSGYSVNEYGETQLAIKGYVNGEEKTIILTDDCEYDFDLIPAGTVIQYLGENKPYAAEILFSAGEFLDIAEFGEIVGWDGPEQGFYAFAGELAGIDDNLFHFKDGTEIEFDTQLSAMKVIVDEDRILSVIPYVSASSDAELGDYILLAKYDNQPLCAIIVSENMPEEDEEIPNYDYFYSFVVTGKIPEYNEVVGTCYGSYMSETLNPEDTYNPFTLTDIYGEPISYDDINAGDIFNVYIIGDTRMILVSQDTIEGTVNIVYQDTNTAAVDGYELKADLNYTKLGDKGIFYIDLNRNIIHFEEDLSDRNFGILHNIYKSHNGADVTPVALISTAENGSQSFDFAPYVYFNNVRIHRSDLEYYDLWMFENKLVLFKLNENNQIYEIYMNEYVEEFDDRYIFESLTEGDYDSENNDLSFFTITDETIVAVCDVDYFSDDPDDFSFAPDFAFEDGERYTFTAYANTSNELLFVLIFNSEDNDDEDAVASEAMYVTSVTNCVDSYGDNAIIVKGYINGEASSVVVSEYVADLDSICVGALIKYEGVEEATYVEVLVAAEEIAYLSESPETTIMGDEEEGLFIAYGKVESYFDNVVCFDNGDEVAFDSDFKAAHVIFRDGLIYKVNAQRVSAGDIQTEEDLGYYTDDYLFLVKYNGVEIGAYIIDLNDDTDI